MTVTELLANFRDGLLSLVPAFERVGIPWRRPDAYDEWDAVATAVYRALVVEPLRSALSEGAHATDLQLTDYDVLLPSYANRSLIEIVPGRSDGLLQVFHALGTDGAPFDTVEWRMVTAETGTPVSDALERTPFKAVRFVIRIPRRGSPADLIQEIPDS